MKRIWAEEEENLRDSWVEVCSKEIASHLNRSPKAVRNKASGMGLHALKRCYTRPKSVKEYTPSPSLAYLIGAIKGDGCVFRYIRKKPTIKVFYRKDSVRRFMRLVGSSIPRKVILRCL
jgi:hypothetical protein